MATSSSITPPRRRRSAARVLAPPPDLNDPIAPMLATASAGLPSDPANFAFEYKWDGVRAICHWDGSRLLLRSRNRLEITGRYPELAPLGAALGRSPTVLDGEIVALDESLGGIPSFALLQ